MSNLNVRPSLTVGLRIDVLYTAGPKTSRESSLGVSIGEQTSAQLWTVGHVNSDRYKYKYYIIYYTVYLCAAMTDHECVFTGCHHCT